MLKRLVRRIFNLLRYYFLKIRLNHKLNIVNLYRLSIRSILEFSNNVKNITIWETFQLQTNAKIQVVDNGILCIGDNFFMNSNSEGLIRHDVMKVGKNKY